MIVPPAGLVHQSAIPNPQSQIRNPKSAIRNRIGRASVTLPSPRAAPSGSEQGTGIQPCHSRPRGNPGSYCLSTTKFTRAPSGVERKGAKESTKRRQLIGAQRCRGAEIRVQGGARPAASSFRPRFLLDWRRKGALIASVCDGSLFCRYRGTPGVSPCFKL
jgi:hypothetical protein